MEFRPKEKDFSQTEKNDSYVAYLEESRKKFVPSLYLGCEIR
ncbi:hypothetical protein LEP1GSC043_1542 [Leptospira weilii str. Ecochallenge]|uniref:Uncharacterized protein n=1 Tax=Leptospira weilii str. Ecochallenge TaxID=1049986 RepID=N1U4D5_9LEPT|nr:hypothetical protein LEP1GSC043_1542 [Leptospira weilii str. Ecochallenge]